MLEKAGANVPAFTFIADFREMNIDYAALTPKFKVPVLEKSINEALEKLGDSQSGFSVRSASFDEDKSDVSAAGKYTSYNGLKSLDNIYEGIINIWKHQRSIASKETLCPIIIQKTHSSYFSGVFFKDSSKEEPVYVAESYFGSCRNIVDGILKPYFSAFSEGQWQHNSYSDDNYCYKFYCNSGLFENYTETTIPGKLLKCTYSHFPSNIRLYTDSHPHEIMVYAYRPKTPPEWYEQLIENELKQLADKLDTGSGADIEWGTDSDGRLYIYQFRPLTRPIMVQKPVELTPEARENQNIVVGSPASPGSVEGYVTNTNLSEKTPRILQLDHASISNLKELEGISAIVCTTGGILSHLAIVSRELNIPCVMGTSDRLALGTKVKVDGSTGIIEQR